GEREQVLGHGGSFAFHVSGCSAHAGPVQSGKGRRRWVSGNGASARRENLKVASDWSSLLTDVRPYLQQQRAWGRDDFRAVVERKTRWFDGVRPAHRPRNTSPASR